MAEISRFEDLVARFCSGLRHRQLYFDGHPEVRACAEAVARDLPALLQETGRKMFFLGVAHGRLLHEGRYLIGPTILGRRLVEFVERMHGGGLLFGAGVDADEIEALFSVAASLSGPTAGLEASRALLRARNVRRVELSPPYEDRGWFGQFLFDRDEEGGSPGDENDLGPVYQSLFDTVDVAHTRAGAGREIDVDGARSVTEALLQAASGGFTDILRLVRYPDYDTFTVGHSVRVALLAVLLGRSLGAETSLLVELGAAGLLHDVGKAKIPETILYKPGRLSDEERRVVAQHPCLGAQILIEHRTAGPLAIGAAFGHHLRHDHRGYPQTARWAVTQRVTAMIQVCDVFEALTAVRPYKAAITPRRAFEMMVAEQGAYDPAVLRAFVAVMGLYPPGSRVRLTSGEEGVVLAAGADPERPQVRLTHDREGAPLPEETAALLDLGAPEARAIAVAHFVVEDAPATGAAAAAPTDSARVAASDAPAVLPPSHGCA